MRDRYRQINIPTEIVRTLIAISETGSFSKAAAMVGLSQPAVSSQMKRMETLLGGAVFEKGQGGSTATKLGSLVLNQARRMMDANDQMIRLRGSTLLAQQPVRFGISNLYVQEYLKGPDKRLLDGVIIHTDNSAEITAGMRDGFIDVACFFRTSALTNDMANLIVEEHDEQFVWARSKDFVISPGAPIPILSWAGAVTDDLMISTLSKRALVPDRVQQFGLPRQTIHCGGGHRPDGHTATNDAHGARRSERALSARSPALEGFPVRPARPGKKCGSRRNFLGSETYILRGTDTEGQMRYWALEPRPRLGHACRVRWLSRKPPDESGSLQDDS